LGRAFGPLGGSGIWALLGRRALLGYLGGFNPAIPVFLRHVFCVRLFAVLLRPAGGGLRLGACPWSGCVPQKEGFHTKEVQSQQTIFR